MFISNDPNALAAEGRKALDYIRKDVENEAYKLLSEFKSHIGLANMGYPEQHELSIKMANDHLHPMWDKINDYITKRTGAAKIRRR